MRTPRFALLLLALVPFAAGLPAPAAAEDAAAPAQRRWHVGVGTASSWRSDHDVFDREGLPPGDVAEVGRGGGVFFGRRFGDRVLGRVQVAYARHDLEGTPDTVADVEILVTGTVLFGADHPVHPFVRGGIGGGGQALEFADGGGNLIAFGPAAIAGGGLHWRVGARVSLEWEAVATFTNFLQVNDETTGDRFGGDDWQVRGSNWGWRAGLGLAFWF
jgi:hypothetical protein